MANHGGKRAGAGRKSKSEEQQLSEKLSPFEKDALKALTDAVKKKQSWAVKLYFEYMYGKPKETVNNNISFGSDFNLKDLYAKDTNT